MNKPALLGLVLAATAGVLLVPMGGRTATSKPREVPAGMDLSAFPATKPATALRMLYIHHSCGGQWLAPVGASSDDGHCIYASHPNGGGLRQKLEEEGYEVHEASYGSDIGEDTDLFHWLPKFERKMDKVLKVSRQDELYPDERKNQIVAFKSCFPSNEFVGPGTPPGNPAGPELNVWNAKAALTALLPEFRKNPNTLFVYVTAPPTAPSEPKERLWKWIARRVLGKHVVDPAVLEKQAALARDFNNWVVSKEGWLEGYEGNNVVVFDYYGVLTGGGESNLSRFASNGGSDSHPTTEGNRRATAEFVPFLNRAVRRAGLSP